MSIPKLERHCGSWIITCKKTGKAVAELFGESVVAKVNQNNYNVETALQYLCRFNQEQQYQANTTLTGSIL